MSKRTEDTQEMNPLEFDENGLPLTCEAAEEFDWNAWMDEELPQEDRTSVEASQLVGGTQFKSITEYWRIQQKPIMAEDRKTVVVPQGSFVTGNPMENGTILDNMEAIVVMAFPRAKKYGNENSILCTSNHGNWASPRYRKTCPQPDGDCQSCPVNYNKAGKNSCKTQLRLAILFLNNDGSINRDRKGILQASWSSVSNWEKFVAPLGNIPYMFTRLMLGTDIINSGTGNQASDTAIITYAMLTPPQVNKDDARFIAECATLLRKHDGEWESKFSEVMQGFTRALTPHSDDTSYTPVDEDSEF